MKTMCFRFDVDTYLCSLKGVPNLIYLAETNDVCFSFFYNIGRAIHLPSILKPNKTQQRETCTDKLSNLNKLGITGYIKTILLNLYVGNSNLDAIVTAHQNGHEIGLHGGTNHGDWMRNSRSRNADKINKEVEWGLSRLNSIGIRNVTSFSSPRWCAPPELANVLAIYEFKAVADIHRNGMEEICERSYI